MLKCRLEANGAKRQSGNVPSKKVDSLPYPSTSTFHSTFCSPVFPFPFCSCFLPGLVKLSTPSRLAIVERRLHCRPPVSVSLSVAQSQFRSQCCYPLSLPLPLSLRPSIRPSACHLPRCIVQTFIKL